METSQPLTAEQLIYFARQARSDAEFYDAMHEKASSEDRRRVLKRYAENRIDASEWYYRRAELMEWRKNHG